MSVRVIATVTFSVGAAFFYATSNVLEQSEAEQIPDEYSLRPSLFFRLVRRPRWLVGFAADAGGYLFAAIALAFGAVVFVQPILSSGLLISLLLAAAINHHRFRRIDLAAAGCFSLGLAVFLLETSATGGRDIVPVHRWVIAAPVIIGVVAVLVVLGRGTRGAPRAALLGVGAGTCFGASAVLTKGFVHYFRDGPFGWLSHWEPYVMAVVIIVGFLIAQSAFQAGSLAASVAGLEATEPVVSVVFGVGLLDEHVQTNGVFDATMVAISAAMVVAAILVLSRAGGREQAAAEAARAAEESRTADAPAPTVERVEPVEPADPPRASAEPPEPRCAIPDIT
ncbi:MAG: hypothetical protein JWL73_2549 [Actinomycetia bacterium]|nr:hypothetical protein [Actinomycetes bacterium]